HRFSRMLARIEPHRDFALAHDEAVDRPAVEAGAEAAVGDAFAGRGLGHEVVMPLERVGREIGEPGEVAGGRVADGQRAAVLVLVECRIGAAPPAAVLGHAGTVTEPAVGVGRTVEVADLQRQLAPRSAGHAEVEPLVEVGLVVARDSQPGGGAIDRKDFDVAAVEGGVDEDRVHRTSIVSPDWPGNPPNSASASLAAAASFAAKSLLAVAVNRARPSHSAVPSLADLIRTRSSRCTRSLGRGDRSMPTPTPALEPYDPVPTPPPTLTGPRERPGCSTIESSDTSATCGASPSTTVYPSSCSSRATACWNMPSSNESPSAPGPARTAIGPGPSRGGRSPTKRVTSTGDTYAEVAQAPSVIEAAQSAASAIRFMHALRASCRVVASARQPRLNPFFVISRLVRGDEREHSSG